MVLGAGLMSIIGQFSNNLACQKKNTYFSLESNEIAWLLSGSQSLVSMRVFLSSIGGVVA
jgi:hypothetical protein